jgi:hypothetical protein
MLNDAQKQAAATLRAARPATLPGTNVIPDEKARADYYSRVRSEMQRTGINTADDSGAFCDVAGIPD